MKELHPQTQKALEEINLRLNAAALRAKALTEVHPGDSIRGITAQICYSAILETSKVVANVEAELHG